MVVVVAGQVGLGRKGIVPVRAAVLFDRALIETYEDLSQNQRPRTAPRYPDT